MHPQNWAPRGQLPILPSSFSDGGTSCPIFTYTFISHLTQNWETDPQGPPLQQTPTTHTHTHTLT